MDVPRTVLKARETEVVIAPDQPFVIVGERINPTNRAKLTETMEAQDMTVVQRDALAQVEAGARVLDINVGTAFGVESEIMPLAVKAVLEVVDVPVAIDSPDTTAIEAGLVAFHEVCGPDAKALINSTTGEKEKLEGILPLAAKYGAAVIGLTNDERGIPETPEERFEIAELIVDKAVAAGMDRQDIIVDGLTLTVGADHTASWCTMTVTERVSREMGLNTISGASNVSFGLPGRRDLNIAFLAMMVARGLNAAITNPLHPEIASTVLATDLFMMRDPNALQWIKAQRAKAKAKES
jgi:5-methyltetrahydrofolate--homocysteine methyltransferase